MPIIFWIIIAGMAACAAALVALPLLRGRAGGAGRGEHALAVYRQQLAELEGELGRGVICAEDAAAARLEIARRMLLADNETALSASGGAQPAGEGRGARIGAAGAALLIPLLAIGIYMMFGTPGQTPDRPAAQIAGADTEHMDMLALTEKLAARLAAAPGDIQGWMLLGRSYVTLEDYPKAISAYAKAVALAGDKPAPMVLAEYAEALVQGNNGLVGEDAQAQFRKVLEIIPTEPRSQFYLGLARAQSGDAKGALEDWVALLKQAEPGVSWAGAVRAQAQEVADLLRVDLAAMLPGPAPQPVTIPGPPVPPPQPGPDADDMAAAAAMPEGERKQMIESMVARLASRLETSEKDNVDGWLRLARAYGVLGRTSEKIAALDKAVAAGPGRADVLTAYGEALQAAGETRPVSDRFAQTMRQLLAIEPENNQALWFLGVFAAQKGEKAQARGYWERLRSQLPPDSKAHKAVTTALSELDKT